MHFDDSPNFNELEKAVVRLAADLTRTPANVSDELYAVLRQHFSERQLVKLTAIITWENARARFNRVYNIQAEGFSKGDFCPLPELPSS